MLRDYNPRHKAAVECVLGTILLHPKNSGLSLWINIYIVKGTVFKSGLGKTTDPQGARPSPLVNIIIGLLFLDLPLA